MCRSKAEGGRRCNGQHSTADHTAATAQTSDFPLTDKFLEENADKGPWPGPPPKKGAPRIKGPGGDIGTKKNPWPKPPWDMTENQKFDHNYDQPVGVGAKDKAQAAKGWVKDKLAGRS